MEPTPQQRFATLLLIGLEVLVFIVMMTVAVVALT
jgi:hypothetical protein